MIDYFCKNSKEEKNRLKYRVGFIEKAEYKFDSEIWVEFV